MIAPIYHHLATNPNYEQTVLGLTTSKITLEKAGIPYISFKDLIGNNTIAREYGIQLAKDQASHPEISEEETVAYLGLSFFDLVQSVGEEVAFELYKEKGRAAFLPIQTLEILFERLKPDLVVATNSPRAERASLIAAKNKSVPSICIVDLPNPAALLGQLAEPGFTSKICVVNADARNILLNNGRPDSEIEVTGNPAFDRLFSKAVLEKATEYKKTHNLMNRFVYLWTRSAVPEDIPLADEIEAKMIDIAKTHPELTFILRPHPNEERRPIPNIPNIIYSDYKDDIAAILHSSNVICTLYSTVGLEAALIGKDVIQFTTTKAFHSVNYVEAKLAHGVKNTTELESLIIELSKAKSMAKKMYPSFATEKISDVIGKVLNISP